VVALNVSQEARLLEQQANEQAAQAMASMLAGDLAKKQMEVC
jgi:hypothetical protein